MERRQFTRGFKLEAVRLIKQRGVSYAQASKDLGVHCRTTMTPSQALVCGLQRSEWAGRIETMTTTSS